jgi:hypothetical protein
MLRALGIVAGHSGIYVRTFGEMMWGWQGQHLRSRRAGQLYLGRLAKRGLVQRVVVGHYRITPEGRRVLKSVLALDE